MTADRLTRDDWLDAAMAALTAGGPDAVKVEPLARALKVTKGSFYWHFKDRSALLRALVTAWEDRETQYLIDTADQLTAPATDILWSLLATKLPSAAIVRQYLVMRYWARSDAMARFSVYAVDARRMAYLEQLFQNCGFTVAEAAARADLFDGLWLNRVLTDQGDETEQMDRLTHAFQILIADAKTA